MTRHRTAEQVILVSCALVMVACSITFGAIYVKNTAALEAEHTACKEKGGTLVSRAGPGYVCILAVEP